MEASRVLTSMEPAEVGAPREVKRGRIVRIRQEVVDFTYTSKEDYTAAYNAAVQRAGLPPTALCDTMYEGKEGEPDRFIFEE